jgi:eukaryotic-like serine/threonine-protein kinase
VAQDESELGTDGSAAVRLGDKFDILPNEPASEFRSPAAEAYRAVSREHAADRVIALICEPGLPPRRDLIEPLSRLRFDGLMRPLAWGVVDWPPRQRRSYALVFDEPGGRIAATPGDSFKPFTEDEILDLVLPSVMPALRAMFLVGQTHRAIRPSNLFRRAGDGRIVLGECLSAPPACHQPLSCEPIESALAAPEGRGAGAPADDLYALGATLVFLLLGRDPTHELADEEILADKINRGSMATLLCGARPPLRMLEAIRGLLADEPRERWTLQELDAWAQGRHVAPRQAVLPRRAGRPIEFNGAEYMTARALARAVVQDPVAAAKLIRSGALDAWLQRSLADPARSTALTLALADAADAEGQETRLAARVAMALDPPAPIRYGGPAAMVDGLGPTLAAAARAGAGVAKIADAIMVRLPQFWFSVQGAFRPDQAPQFKTYDRMRQYLEDRRPGFGFERVVYELNPGLHCLSPAVEPENVVEAGDMLAALERAAKAGRLGDLVIDRHVAAFLAARSKSVGTDWQDDLASSEPRQRTLGTLQLLARLQRLRGPAAVPALGERIGRDAPALIERYHSQTRRARLSVALARIVGSGNIIAIYGLLASPTELRRDAAEFRAARGEFFATEQALAALRDSIAERPQEALELGGRLGVAAAILLGWTAAIASLLMMG